MTRLHATQYVGNDVGIVNVFPYDFGVKYSLYTLVRDGMIASEGQ